MTTLPAWRSFARALVRRRAMERDMDSELQFHVDARTDHLVATGLDRPAAIRQARRELGDPLRWKEQGREARGLRVVDALRADLVYGVRWLCRSPSFAAAAVFSIAIGIGANTAIFGLVNAVLLRLLPVDHPESLVLLSRSDDSSGSGSSFSYPFYESLQSARSVAGVIGRATFETNVEARGTAERVSAEMVSENYFQVLGILPHTGRLFTVEDDQAPGGEAVVVLSHGYWRRRFDGDANVIGTTIRVNAQPMTIVGVTPADFTGIEMGMSPDLRVPIVMQAEMLGSVSRLKNPREWWVQIIARVSPIDGRSRAAVQQELDAMFQRSLAGIASESPQERRLILRDASHGEPTFQNRFTKPLIVMGALSAAVFLLVCLNVANLTLARTADRRRELSIRAALGATGGRIASQLLVEALIIAVIGGAIGLVLARWGSQALATAAVPDAAAALPAVGLDLRVAAFALALSIGAGLICGIWPALAAQRPGLASRLSSEGRTVTGGRLLGRKLLVAGQIMLSFALLTGAGLFVRTLVNLRSLDFGVDTHVLSVRVDPTLAGYNKTQLAVLYNDLRERIAGLPGVRAVSFAAIPLLNRNNWGSGITLDTGITDTRPGPDRNAIGPGYFSAVGLRLVSGREFTTADSDSSPKVAVVNEAFAQKYFAGRAMGRRIGPGDPRGSADAEIVGIVHNAKYSELREDTTPFWYTPYAQLEPLGQSDTAVRISRGLLTVHVRSAGDPAALASAVREAIGAIDRRVTVIDVKTMDQQISSQLTFERLLAGLGAAFAAIATALAALGLYGVTSYDTNTRAREMAVRSALGATRFRILMMILRHTTTLIVAGLGAGVLLELAGIRYLRSMLYGLQPTDPFVLVSATAIVVTVTAVAALVPARRAANTDPASALQ